MGRIVLDTNTLIQTVSRRSRYHDIWLSILDGHNTICVSNEILEEYEEILERQVGHRFAVLVVDVLLNNPYTLFVSPTFRFGLITEDPDDNKFVDCAITAGARFIVTEDHHFNILRTIDFPHVDIIGLDDFLRTLHHS